MSNTHGLRFAAVSSLASLAIVVVTGGLAQAAGWGPLSASYDGSIRATAVGSTYATATQARNDYTLNDPSNDGNNVYGSSQFLFYYGGTFHSAGTVGTGEYDYSDTPLTFQMEKPLQELGTRARTSSKVCVQLGWPVPDRCSATALATFSY